MRKLTDLVLLTTFFMLGCKKDVANYLTNKHITPAGDAYVMATEGLQETFGSRISESIYKAVTDRKNNPSKDRAKLAAEYREGTKGTSWKNP